MKTILKLSTLLFILISLNSVNAQSKENNYDNFLNETIKEIKASYIFPDVANKTADAIAEHQASGKYNGLNKKNFAFYDSPFKPSLNHLNDSCINFIIIITG